MNVASLSADTSLSPRSHRYLVYSGLVLLYVLIHAYVIAFTICPARDGARFIASQRQ